MGNNCYCDSDEQFICISDNFVGGLEGFGTSKPVDDAAFIEFSIVSQRCASQERRVLGASRFFIQLWGNASSIDFE